MKKDLLVGILLALATCWYTTTNAQSSFGGPNSTPKPEWYEDQYPDMAIWATAGVRGGIPEITNIKATLSPGDNIQTAINNGGDGVVLLSKGTYVVKDIINFKSNVILRGVNKDEVTINVDATFSDDKNDKKRMFVFGSGVSYAGVEDLTMVYVSAEPRMPIDAEKLTDSKPNDCFENNEANAKVTFLRLEGEDCWIDNVNLIRSGSDPISIVGDSKHNTIRDVFVDRSYNKGGWGNGYIDIKGDYNLITGCTIKRIRHFAIQNGANHNVVIKNHFEVDINFHNGDDGHNLIEQNVSEFPNWHGWDIFASGGATYGHAPPGDDNIIYNNTTYDYGDNKANKWGGDQIVYVFEDYGRPQETDLPIPACGTFYAVTTGPVINVEGISVSPETKSIEAFESVSLSATVTPSNASNKSVVWISSNEAVARVTSSGEVFGLSQGTVTITAKTTDGNFTDNCRLTVTPATKPGNVALYKTATAIGDDGNAPAGAIDGDVGTRWSNEAMPSWIEIDLGTLKSISSTEVICYQDRAYQYTVEAKASADDAYTQIVDRSNNTTAGSVNSPIIDNFTAVDARYVKVTFTGADAYTGSWTSIQEIRVMGMDAGSTVDPDEPTDPEDPTEPEEPVNPSEDVELSPVADAYMQGTTGYNNTLLKVEAGNRVSYLKFDLSSLSGDIESAQLTLTCDGDAGSGELNIYKGASNAWEEASLDVASSPAKGALLATKEVTYNQGSAYTWDLDVSNMATGEALTLIIEQASGNDPWFSSKEGSAAPVLALTTSEAVPVDGGDGGLIANAGFELGDFTSWTTAGTTSITSDAHLGDYAGKVQDAGQFYQIIALEANTTYTASCYAKVSAVGESVFFGVTNNTTETLIESTKVENTSYAQQSITFTTGSSVEDYKIWFWNNTGGQYFADGFQLVESVATGASAQEVLSPKVYPNPFTDVLNVELSSDNTEVRVISLSGQVVYASMLDASHLLDLSHLTSGVYFVQLGDSTIKVIKE